MNQTGSPFSRVNRDRANGSGMRRLKNNVGIRKYRRLTHGDNQAGESHIVTVNGFLVTIDMQLTRAAQGIFSKLSRHYFAMATFFFFCAWSAETFFPFSAPEVVCPSSSSSSNSVCSSVLSSMSATAVCNCSIPSWRME